MTRPRQKGSARKTNQLQSGIAFWVHTFARSLPTKYLHHIKIRYATPADDCYSAVVLLFSMVMVGAGFGSVVGGKTFSSAFSSFTWLLSFKLTGLSASPAASTGSSSSSLWFPSDDLACNNPTTTITTPLPMEVCLQ